VKNGEGLKSLGGKSKGGSQEIAAMLIIIHNLLAPLYKRRDTIIMSKKSKNLNAKTL